MLDSLPGVLIAALAGALLAFFNFTLTRRAIRSKNGQAGLFSAAPILRMVVGAGYLCAVYFLGPHTPWDRTWLLVGAAAGLTLPLILFTPLLLREADRQKETAGQNDPPKGGDA